MNRKLLMLIIFTLLLFNRSVTASPIFFNKTGDLTPQKQVKPIRKSNLIAIRTPSGIDNLANQVETKGNNKSQALSLNADFWFAFFAIGSLASLWLIKPNKA